MRSFKAMCGPFEFISFQWMRCSTNTSEHQAAVAASAARVTALSDGDSSSMREEDTEGGAGCRPHAAEDGVPAPEKKSDSGPLWGFLVVP